MNLWGIMCIILPWLMKIIWVWPQKIQISKWNFQKEFVFFIALHVCLFWFFRSSISLDPWFALIFKIKTNHFISQRNPILLIICLKKVDSVEFFDLFWKDWNLKNVKWKIAISRKQYCRKALWKTKTTQGKNSTISLVFSFFEIYKIGKMKKKIPLKKKHHEKLIWLFC